MDRGGSRGMHRCRNGSGLCGGSGVLGENIQLGLEFTGVFRNNGSLGDQFAKTVDKETGKPGAKTANCRGQKAC